MKKVLKALQWKNIMRRVALKSKLIWNSPAEETELYFEVKCRKLIIREADGS